MSFDDHDNLVINVGCWGRTVAQHKFRYEISIEGADQSSGRGCCAIPLSE